MSLQELEDAQKNFSCDQAGAIQVIPGSSSYEGIPENLLLNFASWVVSFFYFSCSVAWAI